MFLPPIIQSQPTIPLPPRITDMLMRIVKVWFVLMFLIFVFLIWGCIIRETGETNIEWFFNSIFCYLNK